MEGYTKGFPSKKFGLHAKDTCELFFEDVKVPKVNILRKKRGEISILNAGAGPRATSGLALAAVKL